MNTSQKIHFYETSANSGDACNVSALIHSLAKAVDLANKEKEDPRHHPIVRALLYQTFFLVYKEPTFVSVEYLMALKECQVRVAALKVGV